MNHHIGFDTPRSTPSIRLLAVAKAEGHLDLSTTAQTLRECDQQQSNSSSSSAGVEQAAREEADHVAIAGTELLVIAPEVLGWRAWWRLEVVPG